MEFVGRKVEKQFKGHGPFTGTVRSYDAVSGLFKIVYQDGNSEELDLSEITSHLLYEAVEEEQSRKRRRLGNSSSSGKDVSIGELDLNVNLNVNEGLDLYCVENEGLDLNKGIVDDDGGKSDCFRSKFIDLNLDVTESENLEDGFPVERKGHCFDLNLGLEEENKGISIAEGEGQFEENACGEMGKAVEGEVTIEGNCGNEVSERAKSENVVDVQCGVVVAEDVLNDASLVEVELKSSFDDSGSLVGLDFGSGNGSGSAAPKGRRRRKRKVALDSGTTEAVSSFDDGGSSIGLDLNGGTGSVSAVAHKGRQGRKRKDVLDSGATEAVSSFDDAGNLIGLDLEGINYSGTGVEPKGRCGRKGKVVLDSAAIETVSLFNDGGSSIALDLDSGNGPGNGTAPKGRRGRKRKVVLDIGSEAVAETVLRRSTRRTRKTAAVSDQDNVLTAVSEMENGLLSSPAVSAVTEEKVMEVEEPNVLPAKMELPLSSENLNLEGMPVVDVFSVYSFLRSFSTLLFLSPFELEDFVLSVKCNEPNMLFDSIHVSLLQTLRKHLESLSEDSSQSASNCLRSLDWDLLDLITWPIFMAEYLLMHSSGLKPDFDLCHLELVECDYYRQTPSAKIEILRCLCDDVIEVEAIKSELNRRTLAAEPGIDFDRIVKIDSAKKRKAVLDVTSGSCVTEEYNDETADWNSDECCLCKMEGSLICCDGCPAAFHSRCVGVASNLLPEGDWYCPECLIDKDKPWMKLGKSIRGANLLGIDPYGRLYYSSCGYLLVSDECDGETLFKYYHQSDLPPFIEALKSSETIYQTILKAIFKQWVESSVVDGEKCELDRQPHGTVCLERRVPAISPPLSVHSKTRLKDATLDEGRAEDKSVVSADTECEVAESANMKSEPLSYNANEGNLFVSSEGSAEVSQTVTAMNNRAKIGSDFSNRYSRVSDNSEIPGTSVNVRDCSRESSNLDRKSVNPVNHSGLPSKMKARALMQGVTYVNHYTFARTASAIAEELTQKSSNKNSEDAVKSVEEIISDQLKAISNQFTEFSWPNIPGLTIDVRKEKCGWCFSCKAPEDERECLFDNIDNGPALENCTTEVLGICSRKQKKTHLVDVLCHILQMEDRLRGLILGPWSNPHYSELWRSSLLRASNLNVVKNLLLKLESNLRPLALSADWLKHTDFGGNIGSAVHLIRNSIRGSSRNGIGRKRARCPELETTTSNAASGLSLYWWRGGRLSRKLFNWKVLPRSLASKAGRQAGCKKIPGILYPDSSEVAKRSKFVAWRAAVEASRSVEQLALQVRELDVNIRWDDIENTTSKMDKESQKSNRLFKKVIIRRKCSEGMMVKYLLDFGKRRFIPDVVMKHASKVEECTSERKKYWLEESYVPLYLLKAFEEKRIARKSNKISSGKVRESRRVTRQSVKKKGFSYLFSKAERSEYYQCGHCNKDVLIREAVSCQHCRGFFHKRHVRKSAGAITAECTYTCHKCQDVKHAKVDSKKEKPVSGKNKKAVKGLRLRSKLRKRVGKNKKLGKIQKKKTNTVVVPLRRSPRTAKCVSLQSKKVRAHKRGKQSKSTKGAKKKQMTNTWQKKRTQSYHSYWLNGLRLSTKPKDERVSHFKTKNLLVLCGESTAVVDKLRCSLCNEVECSPMLNYIACEICGDWFHGDAFDRNGEYSSNIIGFKCHKCLQRDPPFCPHFGESRIEGAKFVGLNNDKAGLEWGDEGNSALAAPIEKPVEMDFQLTAESSNLSLAGDHDERLQPGVNCGLIQSLKLHGQKELLPTSLEQKTESVEDFIKKDSWHPDELMLLKDNTLSEEDATNSGQGPGELTNLVEREPQLSKSSQDVSEELTPLTHNHLKNGLVKSTTIFQSVVKQSIDSPEVPPHVI